MYGLSMLHACCVSLVAVPVRVRPPVLALARQRPLRIGAEALAVTSHEALASYQLAM